MARTDTLENFLTDVASAIKVKTGNPTKLKPARFDSEIMTISGGGASGVVPVGIYVQQIGTTLFEKGTTFNLDGYIIEALYSDGSKEDVTSRCEVYSEPLVVEDTQVLITLHIDSETSVSVWQPIKVVEQFVYYDMLYDNSYNDVELNKCSNSVGGGWRTTIFKLPSFYSGYTDKSEFIDDPTCLYWKYGGAYQGSGYITNLPINLTPYALGIIQVMSNQSSQLRNGSHNIRFTTKNDGSTDGQTNNFITSINPANNTKHLLYVDLTNLVSEKYLVIADNEGGNSTDLNYWIKAYNVILFKKDPWEKLGEMLGLEENTITNILAQSSTFLNDGDMAEYVLRNCTGEFMGYAIQSSTFLTAFNECTYRTDFFHNAPWFKMLTMLGLTE